MTKKELLNLKDILTKYNFGGLEVLETRTEKTLKKFHQWADLKAHFGSFLISDEQNNLY